MKCTSLFADRKAVISQGMLKCVGSSMFLKSKWGIGYRLRYLSILYWLYSLLYSLSIVIILRACLHVLWTVLRFWHSLESIQSLLSGYFKIIKKLWFFFVFSSMYIDRYCATESLSSLVKQHIPGATLLQQNDQQLVYSLPFKDMDKFSGITSFQFLGGWTRILH